jgi:hypothetical protein
MFRVVPQSRLVVILALGAILPACGGGSSGGAGGESPAAENPGTPDPVVTPPVPPTTPAPAAAVDANLASPASLASVTEGAAPLAVVFHAVGATVNGSGQAVAQPADGDYGSVRYAWDFGDPSSGLWPTSLRSRNSDTGFCAAHVYERPGTYTCALTVVDRDGAVHAYAQRIVVSAFAGQTYYVSDLGDDAASGLSEASPWRTVAKARANLGPNRRVLFRRGGAFDVDAPVDIQQPGPGLIGAYGPSSSPRPVLRCRSSGFTVYRDDWRLVDLDLRGPSGGALGLSLSSSGGIDRVLMLRVATRGFEVGISWSNIDHAPPHDAIVVAECETTGSRVNGFYVGARRLALLGNTVSDSQISHVTRVWQANRSVIGHNVFVRPGGDRHSLKLHGPPTWETTPKTEYVTVANNLFQGNLWTVVVAPQNAISDEPVSHVLIERNRTLSVPMTQADYVVEARDVTIRNNVMDGTRAASRFVGVQVQAGGVVRTPGRVRVESNTMYKGSFGVQGRMVLLEGGAFDVLIRNNFASFPAVVPGNRGVIDGTGPGLVLEDNLVADVPGFVDAAGGDFHLLPSSPAVDAALPSTRVTDDYDEAARPASARDLGAFER